VKTNAATRPSSTSSLSESVSSVCSVTFEDLSGGGVIRVGRPCGHQPVQRWKAPPKPRFWPRDPPRDGAPAASSGRRGTLHAGGQPGPAVTPTRKPAVGARLRGGFSLEVRAAPPWPRSCTRPARTPHNSTPCLLEATGGLPARGRVTRGAERHFHTISSPHPRPRH
jgi:hypothetical protein